MYEAVLNMMPFIQAECVREGLEGEEAPHFNRLMTRLGECLEQCPKLYAQEDSRNPIVYLHYFFRGSDWWVLEYDREDGTLFCYACLNNDIDRAELGYSTLKDLKNIGAELDMDFWQTPLEQIKTMWYKDLRKS